MEAAHFQFSRRGPATAAVAPKPADGGGGAGTKAEWLNQAVVQQLNLESVNARAALGLFKAIPRILEDFDLVVRTNSTPKW